MKRVIFACVQSAGRSQMAAAFFDAAAADSISALSAGTRPAEHVHPEVVEVMREVGIDLSRARPNALTPALAATASLLVTMGCGESCPYVPGLETLDWKLDDPHGRSPGAVRAIRDEIRTRVEALVRERGWARL